MKTIVIFSSYCLPFLGGIEAYIDNLIKELIKNKYKVVLVTTQFNDKTIYDDNDKIDVIRLPIYKTFKNRYPIPKYNREQKRLLKQLDNLDISAIIVNTRFHLTSHIGAKYANKNRIPVFLIEHGSSYITLNNRFIDIFANIYERYLTRRIKKRITGFYGVSDRCNQWLKKLKINPSGIFYNAIDEDIYNKNKKYIKENNKIEVTYAGRILVEKGVINLLEAFKKINNKNCVLNIAGDGPILGELKNKYQDKNINFLGRIPHDDVIKIFAKTDIFVYPSMYPEGLPTSILEAGIMKCAVIATDRGGTKEVINDKKYGIIVEENIDDLKDKLEMLVNDKKKINTFKENLHKRVIEKFVWRETVKCIITEVEKNERK